MSSIVRKPPNRSFVLTGNVNIFLAGSIEMGTAEPWQDELIKQFPTGINFLNPKRDAWDASWTQELNCPHFYEQVTWELDMLDRADIIPMYFDPTTKSPITLAELGLNAQNVDYAGRPRLIVCCPDGYWRKGNVDIICQRYGIPYFVDKQTWVVAIKNRIELIKTRL